MDKPSFCVALKCSLCCYFTNHKTVEQDGFTVSAEYDRPINTNLHMSQEFFEAGAQEEILNEEEKDFTKEQYSPCVLLGSDGLCRGHDCAENKGLVELSDGKKYEYARLNEIYHNTVKTDTPGEVEQLCPDFSCHFKDGYDEFVQNHSEEVLAKVTIQKTLKERFDALKQLASEKGFVPKEVEEDETPDVTESSAESKQ
ncbi:hypothetical protein HUU53_02670 [Candidatus Micrarchaeota archaeon]|nr:hypothetical protein [Candidatus Micrarchaeota archaeon]